MDVPDELSIPSYSMASVPQSGQLRRAEHPASQPDPMCSMGNITLGLTL